MSNNNYESLIAQLQKETQEKLRKQDHIIAKLEKKIDKMQAANHQQMQTLDVRMQQMMGMFQMFMMNQTIGMNQIQQQQPGYSNNNTLNNKPNLPQSKSAMNLDDHNHINNNKGLHISAKQHALKQRSINTLDDNTSLRTPDSEYDTEDPLSDNEYNNHKKRHNKKHHKHKSKKKKKKEKSKKDKDKYKEKEKDKNTHHIESIPTFDDNNIDINVPPPPSYKSRGRSSTTNSQNSTSNTSRPIPPPPPMDNKPTILNSSSSSMNNVTTITNPYPPPPIRTEPNDRDHRSRDRDRDRDSKRSKKHRDSSRSRNKHKSTKHKSKHQSSHSEQMAGSHRNKHKQKSHSNVEVVSFVEINTAYGKVSPTQSDSRTLLDHLAELELDVDTPSDEESLLYLQDDGVNGGDDDDPDIDNSDYWNQKQKKSNKLKNKLEVNDEDDSGEDDISILSALKNPNSGIIDGDSDDDSDYSDDSLHSSEDEIEEYNAKQMQKVQQEEEHLSKAERKRRKKERKKQKKREKKRKKKEKKREEKRRKKELKDKKNSTSMQSLDTKEKEISANTNNTIITKHTSRSTSLVKDGHNNDNDDDNINENDIINKEITTKKRTTITGKIKKIGQKFKIGFKDKDDDDNSIGSNNSTFKDMFKVKSKTLDKEKDEIPSTTESSIPFRSERAKTTVTREEMEKKNKKKFGLRGFKARIIKAKGNDDNLVDYGKRIENKKRRRKPRRGSDSNISNMSIDPWFESKNSNKKNKKKNAKFNIGAIDTEHNILQPDDDVTPPPSPLNKYGNRFNITDSDNSNSDEIDLKLNDDMSGDNMYTNLSKKESIDNYRKESRGGSKSTNNTSVGQDRDIINEENRDAGGDHDPDIDLGDYDWNSYTVKLKETHSAHSDEEIQNNNLSSPKPKPQETRPHSARVNNGKSKKKGKKGFFKDNNKPSKIKEKEKEKEKERRIRKKTDDKDKDKDKNTKGHKRKNSKGTNNKKNKKNDKKTKRPKGIEIIAEDKKSKTKKSKTAKTPTLNTNNKSNKMKKRGSGRMFNEDKKLGNKRNSGRIFNEKSKKKKKGDKLGNKTPPFGGDYKDKDDAYDNKEPEVLIKARGQSMDQIASDDNINTGNTMEVDYMFANKRLKSIVPKMDYKSYENKVEIPEYKLALEHVIGYNGYDNLCRNNLYTLNNGNLVYNIGCLAIVHDINTNKQKIYSKHQSPITSITIDKRKGYNYIISASLKNELSKTTSIIKIWDGNTLNTINEIKCTDIVGQIRHLNVSQSSGILYLTCGENNKNTRLLGFNMEKTNLYNLKPEINIEFRTINNKNVQIYGMIFNSRGDINDKYVDQFVVYGSNILYWCEIKKSFGKLKYCKINKLQPKGSTDGKKEKAYHCGLFLDSGNKCNPGYYILGGQSGSIYIGYKNTIILSLSGHTARIQSINKYNVQNQFISIGYDGLWKIWNIDYNNNKMKEISEYISKLPSENNEYKEADSSKEEYESKRNISDYSNKIIKSSCIKIISEDSFVPLNDCGINKYPHCSYYDKNCIYIGTNCNSIVSVSNINIKSGDNDLQIIFGGHNLGIIGIAISPKLDSLIATLSEDGLIRLWNTNSNSTSSSKKKNKKNNNKRLDNCVALQSLIKKNNKLKSSVITWSPDGKFIATGYNISKVCLCTAHPLKKCQEIDLSQYKIKNKSINKSQSITALCFSYNKSNVLAIGHYTQLSLFNIDKINNSNKYKCVKWDNTITFNNDCIKHLYFSENDDMLCVVTEKYDTKFYNISMKKKIITSSIKLPKSNIVWWPRIPLTSYILKGLYQKNTMKWNNKYELCDADICQSLKIVASADKFGCIRLHKLPAINEKSNNIFKYHYGQISKILFIPEQERLISVGLHDRSIIKWSIQY